MTEYDKARAWRESLHLSRRELAERLGLAAITVYWMEKGIRPRAGSQFPAKPVDPRTWRRYKLACAGLHQELMDGGVFDWNAA
jgi:DNA-binding XRE family transcriptional regulator